MSNTQPSFPLFYERPEVLQAERHAALKLDPEQSYAFAAKAVSVPISAVEAPLVARHYPIVFSSGAEGLPLAVLALRRDENLFVDAAGHWLEGVHIPAYMRRYPFIFAAHEDVQRFTLCVDTASGRIGTERGSALFEGGKPTAVTESALTFCTAFEREIAETRKIVAGFNAHALLVKNEASVTLASGSRFEMRDFLVLDAAKVDALSDDALLDLKRLGGLPLMFAHFTARASWGDLVRRLEKLTAN